MFGLFKKETPLDKLNTKYKKLMDESYRLSHTDRRASDLKRAEAEEVLAQMDELKVDS